LHHPEHSRVVLLSIALLITAFFSHNGKLINCWQFNTWQSGMKIPSSGCSYYNSTMSVTTYGTNENNHANNVSYQINNGPKVTLNVGGVFSVFRINNSFTTSFAYRSESPLSLFIGGYSLIDIIYPVGSIIWRYDTIDPKMLPGFQRTFWVQITGYFLRPANSVGVISGGTETTPTVLTIDQIPSHNHQVSNYQNVVNSAGGSACYYFSNTSENQSVPGSASGVSGGNQGHSHTQSLPPNMTVYCWRRVK
jgi:hypothetical protein